jgi:hypothetical protein
MRLPAAAPVRTVVGGRRDARAALTRARGGCRAVTSAAAELATPSPDSCAYWLSALSAAMAACDCRLAAFVASRPSLYGTFVGTCVVVALVRPRVTTDWPAGGSSGAGGLAYTSEVRPAPAEEARTRLDGVLRRFALQPGLEDVRAGARFSWELAAPRPGGLLYSVWVCAEWPLFPRGAHAENEFHSTLRPERAPGVLRVLRSCLRWPVGS